MSFPTSWLIIDTSLEIHRFALWDQRELWQISLPREESMLQAMALLEKKIQKDLLLGIFLAKGPGSYTGLRWGHAFAAGLAYALELPLFAFSSFLPYSEEAKTSFVLFDARAGGLYAGSFDSAFFLQRSWSLRSPLEQQTLLEQQSSVRIPEEMQIPSFLKEQTFLQSVPWNAKTILDAAQIGAVPEYRAPFAMLCLEYGKEDDRVAEKRLCQPFGLQKSQGPLPSS